MENLQIGVCDDDPYDMDKVLELIRKYDVDGKLQILTFSHASALLQAAQKIRFDIVILDIQMEPPTGFDVGKQLITLPEAPIVIFATQCNDYAIKGYGIAIRYLQKPITQDDFFEAMDAAFTEATAHRLTFQVEKTLVSVRLYDVQYIESYGHYVVMHTGEESYRFRGTLKDIFSRLPKGFFVSPHKSYIVNLEHVKSATASEICMNCGSRIPIGRKRGREFNHALYRFLGR